MTFHCIVLKHDTTKSAVRIYHLVAAFSTLVALIVTIYYIAHNGWPGLVNPTVDETAEDSISNLSPELRCTGFDAMGEWCRQNRDMCFQRIEECHELMDGAGQAIGTCKAYLAFAVILCKYFTAYNMRHIICSI